MSAVAEKQRRSLEIYAGLKRLHPDAHCELDHRSAFELLVATVLSAQTTDKLVNKVTPALFEAYPNAKALAAADLAAVEQVLRERGMGMYRQKSKNIVGLAQGLVRDHGGEVPRSMDALVKLPGVGRKTANVVLGVMWGTPDGVVVDTHVMRLSQRLGFTKETDPESIEQALCKIFPREEWDPLSHTLIFHGRRVCFAVKPACAACGVSSLCPSAFKADLVGRKIPKAELVKRAAKRAAAKVASTAKAAVRRVKKVTAKEKAAAPSRATTPTAARRPGSKPVAGAKKKPTPSGKRRG